jgi:hypothetical protein
MHNQPSEPRTQRVFERSKRPTAVATAYSATLRARLGLPLSEPRTQRVFERSKRPTAAATAYSVTLRARLGSTIVVRMFIVGVIVRRAVETKAESYAELTRRGRRFVRLSGGRLCAK